MKSILKTFSLFVLLLFSNNLVSQAPSQSDAVMMQGFYWDSTSATSWNKLYQIAGELSSNFDIIWLPPSAFSSGGTGYMPKQWSNQNSAWGTRAELDRLINALKDNGSRVMADIVVNHRDGKSSWIDFYPDDFGSYGQFQLNTSHICKNDEAVTRGHLNANQAGAVDTGENFDGARDLDHTSPYVQDAVKAYLKWMKNVMGYDGWRYDMVKGFSGSYINSYNAAGGAYISVGEFWDGNYDLVMNWINSTGKTSTAFDFPMKYAALNNGLAGNNYGNMAWNDNGQPRPAGLIHSPQSRRYSVTFVDNHDTYRDGSKYTGDVQKANAFILSSPGIPCVFYPHWNENKTAINAMITARKSVGLHNESDVRVQNTSGYYKAYSMGTCGEMITYIGSSESSWSSDAPSGSGWIKACSGNGWAMYTKVTDTTCAERHEQRMVDQPDPITPFTSITITAQMPGTWTTPHVHVWNSGISGAPQITSTDWPGDRMTKVEENIYTITLTGFTLTTEVGIVFNNGSNAMQTVDLLTSESPSCWTISSTPTVGTKYEASKVEECFVSTTQVNSYKNTYLKIYPNPAEDLVFIDTDKYTLENDIFISDVYGRRVAKYQHQKRNDKFCVDVSNLSPGVYLMKINNEILRLLKK